MKYIKYILFLLGTVMAVEMRADEGMWMIHALDAALEKKMQERGLELSAREIYNADAPGSSVADAVVSLEFGCTGSIISDQGLLITNHHCAYGDVHRLSTPEHNYLEEGFWAMTSDEEKNINGKKAYFLKRVLDVTEEVAAFEAQMKAEGKPLGSRKLSYLMEKKYSKETGLEAWLASMWRGSKYYIALYEVYSDVRLVAAPPVSAAAFGGDIDNWEWPQHKCDFAMYRVYTAPDGSPAEYSADNIPMKPQAKLKISLEGYKPGDYTMVIGYPGTTNRYSSSFETHFNETLKLPIANQARGDQMAIIKGWMDEDADIRLKYSDYYFGLSNVQEYSSGEVECFGRFDVVESKQGLEKELQAWIEADPQRLGRWGDLLETLGSKYAAVTEAERNVNWLRESIVRGTRFSRVINKIASHRSKDNQSLPKSMMKEYEKLDLRVEKDLFIYAVKQFYSNVEPATWGPYHKELFNKLGSAGEVAEYVWSNSVLTDMDRAEKYMAEGHSKEEYMTDPAFRFFQDIKVKTFNDIIAELEGEPKRLALRKEYTQALYQMYLDKGIPQYPDANSTMRITYGTVGTLEPRDGVICDWKTTPAGILEKYNPADYDFSLSDRQYLLYRQGNWGKWGFNADGAPGQGSTMYVNFLTDNDITGGNSGSPVMNSRGELIGLAFDGNKESLASDMLYTSDYNKCVCVDIRFILWTLDRYAGMTRIIEELGL
jgi:hypothetical protein